MWFHSLYLSPHYFLSSGEAVERTACQCRGGRRDIVPPLHQLHEWDGVQACKVAVNVPVEKSIPNSLAGTGSSPDGTAQEQLRVMGMLSGPLCMTPCRLRHLYCTVQYCALILLYKHYKCLCCISPGRSLNSIDN